MTYRTLIVEDDPKWRDRLTRLFQGSLNYSVVAVDNYEDAIRTLEAAEDPFDLVSLDMQIPVQSQDDSWVDHALGYHVLKHIQSNYRGELCIIVSGAEPTAMGKATNWGVEYFEKLMPFRSILIGVFNKNAGYGDISTRIPREMAIRKLKFFVSYRRQESQDITGRICDRLGEHFGRYNIFYDQDSIPLGVDFRDHIRQQVQKCQALLVVIGRNWTTLIDDEGEVRLNNPLDFVRLEINEAFEHDIPVIPLLVGGAPIPDEDELPSDLKPLSYQQGLEMRSDAGFHASMDVLIRRLEALAGS